MNHGDNDQKYLSMTFSCTEEMKKGDLLLSMEDLLEEPVQGGFCFTRIDDNEDVFRERQAI